MDNLRRGPLMREVSEEDIYYDDPVDEYVQIPF